MRLVLTPELRRAAQRCIWFEPPETAVVNPARLAAYILTYGGQEDVNALRVQLSEEDLKALLDAAPPKASCMKSDPRRFVRTRLPAPLRGGSGGGGDGGARAELSRRGCSRSN